VGALSIVATMNYTFIIVEDAAQKMWGKSKVAFMAPSRVHNEKFNKNKI